MLQSEQRLEREWERLEINTNIGGPEELSQMN